MATDVKLFRLEERIIVYFWASPGEEGVAGSDAVARAASDFTLDFPDARPAEAADLTRDRGNGWATSIPYGDPPEGMRDKTVGEILGEEGT